MEANEIPADPVYLQKVLAKCNESLNTIKTMCDDLKDLIHDADLVALRLQERERNGK